MAGSSGALLPRPRLCTTHGVQGLERQCIPQTPVHPA